MRTLLVDDHKLFRQGLKFLLEDLDATIDFLEADTCEQALALPSDSQIDLVLLDFHLPGLHALDALVAVRETFDSAPIVILSSEDDPHVIRSTIEHGAAGFIPKSSTPEVLVAALRLILAGGIYLPRNAIGSDVTCGTDDQLTAESHLPAQALSARQREVLLRVIQGKPNKVVARELDIAEGTVKAHLSAAFRALGVANRTEAVYVAARLGLTSAD